MGGYADGEQSIRRGLVMQAAGRARLHTDSITRSTASHRPSYPKPDFVALGLDRDDMCLICLAPLIWFSSRHFWCASGRRGHRSTTASPVLIARRCDAMQRALRENESARAAQAGRVLGFERDEDEEELDA